MRPAVLIAVALIAAGCGATQHRPPAGFEPVSVTAAGGTFWILGTVPCGTRACTSIARTTDGGAHFVSVSSPPGIDTLRFGNREDGYAFNAQRFGAATGSALWQTEDGGAHWRLSSLRHVRAFAIGGGSAFAVTAGRDLELNRSALAGRGWTARRLPVAAVEPLVALTAYGSHVWVSVSPVAGSRQILLTSSDGGRTFATGPSPCLNGLGGRLTASSGSVVWAACPTGMLAGVERTVDAGRTWSPLASGELPNVAAIVPATPDVALLATGDRAELLRTQDGGRTFSVVAPPRPGRWDSIAFAGRTTALALRAYSDRAGDSLVRSADGGRHWSGPIPVR